MKRNVIGLNLCAIYLAATAACWAIAWSAGADFKGRFVFLQLPIALQAALVDALGFSPQLSGLSWFACYAIFLPLTLGLLYGVGWLVTRLLALVPPPLHK